MVLLEYIKDVYRHWVFSITSTILAVAATGWGVAGGKPLGAALTAVIALALFLIAGFLAWKEKRDQLMRVNDREKIATAFREAWDEANEMWSKGLGCQGATDADAWCERYDKWIREVKARIERDAGRNEVSAVFGIGNTGAAVQIHGQSPRHANRLTFLNHHMVELKAALKRYLAAV